MPFSLNFGEMPFLLLGVEECAPATDQGHPMLTRTLQILKPFAGSVALL